MYILSEELNVKFENIDRIEHVSIPQSLVRKWLLENKGMYKSPFVVHLYYSVFFEKISHSEI